MGTNEDIGCLRVGCIIATIMTAILFLFGFIYSALTENLNLAIVVGLIISSFLGICFYILFALNRIKSYLEKK